MPNYGMKSGLADSVKATGKRELHEPWTPNFDFGVEERPIPPNSFDPQQQYYKTQEGISGLGDAYGDRAAHEAFALGRDTVNSNSDAVKQERIQQLYTRLDEVNARIQELKVEISYQEKLQKLEQSGDPLWEMAKDKYIHTGDMSDLQTIMQRISTEDLARYGKDNQKEESIKSLQTEVDEYRAALESQWAGFKSVKDWSKEDNERIIRNIAGLRLAERKLAQLQGVPFDAEAFAQEIRGFGIDEEKLNAMYAEPYLGQSTSTSGTASPSSDFDWEASKAAAYVGFEDNLKGNNTGAINDQIDALRKLAEQEKGDTRAREAERQKRDTDINNDIKKLENRKEEILKGDQISQVENKYQLAGNNLRARAQAYKELKALPESPERTDRLTKWKDDIEAMYKAQKAAYDRRKKDFEKAQAAVDYFNKWYDTKQKKRIPDPAEALEFFEDGFKSKKGLIKLDIATKKPVPNITLGAEPVKPVLD